ncbi:MAG: dipeptide ABC transporter ATP-binding protein [Planctomycetes bacterium]|nr:dipeptide ABC transporter ATP-binding protein [Planctomycetota bacterium]
MTDHSSAATLERAHSAADRKSDRPILSVDDLKVYFPVKRGLLSKVVAHVKAVDGVSFDLHRGETLGLVGESGCGKTTVGRSILRLIEPTSGDVYFEGEKLQDLSPAELRERRRRMQIIFQDPYSSLNPRMTVEGIIGEAFTVHGIAKGDERRARVRDLLSKVGLQPDYINRYPHEFSGGQRQRVGIARAIALNPSFIVCDEAVSALDVSIQAQVINLLEELQQEMGLSYLFIAHNLAVVEHISDRVAVMYLGKIVETASSIDLYKNPTHPYTRALLSAVPHPDPTRQIDRVVLQGDVPTPLNPPSGCRFHPRCPIAESICSEEIPRMTDLGNGHQFACHVEARKLGK